MRYIELTFIYLILIKIFLNRFGRAAELRKNYNMSILKNKLKH